MFEGVSTRNKYSTVFIRLPLVPRKLAPGALYSFGKMMSPNLSQDTYREKSVYRPEDGSVVKKGFTL